jgi:ATP-dependent DNA helicase RecG
MHPLQPDDLPATYAGLTGLIKKYGSGIQRIIKYFKEAQLPIPKFRNISEGFMVTAFAEKSKVGDKVTDKVTDNQMKIINLIKRNSHITTKEISDNIKISQRKVKENMAKLKQMGILKRLGSAKTGHWEVKGK